jgi:hypothetical protein
MKSINLKAIRIDGGTQSRVALNESTVAEYAEAIADGVKLPPVTVFFDGSDNWLADGFHRFHAYSRAGKASLPAEVSAGTQADAVLYAAGANSSHGLRRSNADKRRAVEMVLTHPAAAEWSDRKIADHCGVSVPFVSALRRPEVAQKQQERNANTAAKRVLDESPTKPKGCKPITPEPQAVESSEETAPGADELAEAHHTITELAQENERLQDRLYVEAMDASEEEKTQAAETIRSLRSRVVTLEAEVAALKVSRDTFMREANEAKKSAIYWRKRAEKVGAEGVQ